MDARGWDERYAASELVWSATPNRFVASELADLTPGRAVDVACGEGRNAIWLADRGWEVTAVDFSLVGLDKGREIQARHPHGRDLHIDWVHADVRDHQPGPTGFDLVVIAYLHLAEDEMRGVIRRFFGSLVDGGTFFLVGHDSSNLDEGTGGPQDPGVLYTAEDVLADLDGERFEVVRADRVERPVETGLVAYDALVRLVRTTI